MEKVLIAHTRMMGSTIEVTEAVGNTLNELRIKMRAEEWLKFCLDLLKRQKEERNENCYLRIYWIFR
jgi:hypothetical protein